MLEILLDALKDPKGCALEAKNGEGDTLLEVAEGESHDEVIDYLRDLLGLQGGGLSNMCILM